MKKITFILGGLFLMSIALTSCKKDYTCECKDNDGTTQSYPYLKTTKKSAQDLCDLAKVGWDSCELK